MEFKLPLLPPNTELETPKILKQLAKAHRYLAELKGTAKTIPNESILIDTLTLQEAKDSSEIENIVTTHDDLYKENIFIESKSTAAKEVYNYARGLKLGFEIVRKERLLLNKHILTIQKELLESNAGFRTQAGTKLVNSQGKVVYTPPQHPDEILDLMSNFEKFINNNDFSDLDSLIKMTVIHYQFESIHPFYDGNGRTGRIINILYLVQQGLLDIPVLYLSRFITQNKSDYYKVLQEVRTNNDWESLVLYLLKGVEVTAKQTITLITEIKVLMQKHKVTIRTELPKIYSQDLINNLFKNPYTKIEYLENDLKVTRQTASNYLNKISSLGLLEKVKVGKVNYYINSELINVLVNV
ncbi:Fic family protein [Flavivirga eckloniae]|uniref:Addiction module protein n=1 Tax=Flavivirga eckloniae TaxID=1803846 RepID=A0A2K9PMR3_9FLAO|nr:Fic family protein [Flavivirga eckloniae]AUP78316.1 addiction module protein [Flavivirga eckloniae]